MFTLRKLELLKHQINKERIKERIKSLKHITLKICTVIYHNLTKKNLDKGIYMIQKGTSMISEFGKAFDSGSRKTPGNQNIRSAFWGESKTKTMSFYGKKKNFFGN